MDAVYYITTILAIIADCMTCIVTIYSLRPRSSSGSLGGILFYDGTCSLKYIISLPRSLPVVIRHFPCQRSQASCRHCPLYDQVNLVY